MRSSRGRRLRDQIKPQGIHLLDGNLPILVALPLANKASISSPWGSQGGAGEIPSAAFEGQGVISTFFFLRGAAVHSFSECRVITISNRVPKGCLVRRCDLCMGSPSTSRPKPSSSDVSFLFDGGLLLFEMAGLHRTEALIPNGVLK